MSQQVDDGGPGCLIVIMLFVIMISGMRGCYHLSRIADKVDPDGADRRRVESRDDGNPATDALLGLPLGTLN